MIKNSLAGIFADCKDTRTRKGSSYNAKGVEEHAPDPVFYARTHHEMGFSTQTSKSTSLMFYLYVHNSFISIHYKSLFDIHHIISNVRMLFVLTF